MDLAQWFSVQPDTVKGAILGAFAAMLGAAFAVLGVAINAWVAHRNTGRQLEHDQRQRATERSLTLRREIYLGVMEHLAAGLDVIANLPDLGIPLRDLLQRWRNSSHFMAKLHLMAQPELLRAVTEANGATSSAILVLRPGRDRLEFARARIQLISTAVKDYQMASSRAMQALRDRELAGGVANEEAMRLIGLGERENERSREWADKQLEQEGRFNTELANFLNLMLTEQSKIIPLLVPVIAAARKELGEPFDPATYEHLLNAAARNVDQVREPLRRMVMGEALGSQAPQ